MNDIADMVIQDMAERKAGGIATYGVPLRANNGRNALVDAYEECLDMACYLKQAIVEEVTATGCIEELYQDVARRFDVDSRWEWNQVVDYILDRAKADRRLLS